MFPWCRGCDVKAVWTLWWCCQIFWLVGRKFFFFFLNILNPRLVQLAGNIHLWQLWRFMFPLPSHTLRQRPYMFLPSPRLSLRRTSVQIWKKKEKPTYHSDAAAIVYKLTVTSCLVNFNPARGSSFLPFPQRMLIGHDIIWLAENDSNWSSSGWVWI